MKLISMISFVLEQKENMISKLEEAGSTSEDYKKVYDFARLVINYAKFLKQPLTLGMFVPCDDYGNILSVQDENNYHVDYFKFKDKVLFKDFEITNDDLIYHKKAGYVDSYFCENNLIENLILLDVELTESAIKQIGL